METSIAERERNYTRALLRQYRHSPYLVESAVVWIRQNCHCSLAEAQRRIAAADPACRIQEDQR